MKTIQSSAVFFALCLSAFPKLLFAQDGLPTPCMDVLSRFTAAGVPTMAPEEEAVKFGKPDAVVPPNLPGNGLAQHPMLYVGENCNEMFLVKDGKPIWTYSTGKGPEFDDVWM